jgi:hypothetical protein
MWIEVADSSPARIPAEIGSILRIFFREELTGRKRQDCYTFEHVASISSDIRNTYYYHHKRTRHGLKEETRWS